MLDSLSELIQNGLVQLLSFFPDSPFVVLKEMTASTEIVQWLAFLNWFIPVNVFVAILEAWLTCIGVYYIWQIIMRWLKMIE